MNAREYIKNNITFLDGGMGTLLQENGLLPGEATELWNISHPEVVTAIHKAYYDCGSNIIATNTFGANSLKYDDKRLESIIKAAVGNAKEARKLSSGKQDKFIALDIGPTGRLIKPYGDLDFEDAIEIFAKTVRLGKQFGADLVIIETMNDSYETKAAVLAAKENCDLPIFVSNAYGEDGKLMTGATPDVMAAMLEGLGVDAIGVNCSFGPEKLIPVVNRLLEVSSLPVIFKPNAGLPCERCGKTEYNVLPDEFAARVSDMLKKGVRIAGGCCGTTPEYIKALVKAASGIEPLPVTEKKMTVVASSSGTVTIGKKPVLIGERINPTGKKRLKEALREKDFGYILKEGISQEEAGAHILDVNAGLPDINETEMLSEIVERLQAVSLLPVQVDTSSPEAMEKALRIVNGKAMINSVNGKEESMRSVFPIAKKYGGVIVALTLDENGIPDTAEGRVQIAERILRTAAEYGIPKKDIIFDTLAMTVSADKNAPGTTLRAMKEIKTRLGCNTSLGVSNVSYGLPERDKVNAAFFTLALENGLSAAIMNPFSKEMKDAYYAFNALSGNDENCAEYIAYASGLEKTETKYEAPAELSLFDSIKKGLSSSAASATRKLLETERGLDIVNNEIIPALDEVGRGYEAKTVYLPQLLMSADAAKNAFEVIKESASNGSAKTKCRVVLATVKGDIHDIGKNIVKLLLENYGFAVTDLGKDVPPEKICETVKKLDAPLVGLSALMTTTVPAMEKTIKLLHKEAPSCRIVVGGAVLNEEYANRIGADRYASDAMETVRYAEEINLALK